MFLDYASISGMNNTLDAQLNPIELEYWIFTILDYISFLHRFLHVVNLDIKPKNIFIGRLD
jgi:serine/threonine protein kinase